MMLDNHAYVRRQPLRQLLARAAGTILPRAQGNICLHREWSKFGIYDETTFCRLTDDLC